MSQEIIIQCILGFTSQYAFLYFRTLNIIATNELDVKKVLLTGAAINALWLIGISLGANGVKELMLEQQWQYIPVVACIMVGSLLGSYIGLKKKIKDKKAKSEI